MIRLDKFDNQNFSRGVSALKEGLWWVVRSLLFAHSFPLPSSLKVAALRAFGAEVGEGVVIRSKVNITFPWRLKMGDHVWIGDEVMILSLADVEIGSHVCISQRAFLCTGSHDFRKETFDLITKPIRIGNSSWVGAMAFIPPGAVVPEGTMVKAMEVWRQVAGSRGTRALPE